MLDVVYVETGMIESENKKEQERRNCEQCTRCI